MARYKIYYEYLEDEARYPGEDYGYVLGRFDSVLSAWKYLINEIGETFEPLDVNESIKIRKWLDDNGDTWIRVLVDGKPQKLFIIQEDISE